MGMSITLPDALSASSVKFQSKNAHRWLGSLMRPLPLLDPCLHLAEHSLLMLVRGQSKSPCLQGRQKLQLQAVVVAVAAAAVIAAPPVARRHKQSGQRNKRREDDPAVPRVRRR